jgi:hypothetical protein
LLAIGTGRIIDLLCGAAIGIQPAFDALHALFDSPSRRKSVE